MMNLNHKTIRPTAAFGIIFCLLFSMFATPFAAAREANIFNRATRIPPAVETAQPEAQTSQNIRRDFGNIPLSFEQNTGQTDGQVKFLARSLGYTMFFTETGAVLKMRRGTGEKVSESV